MAQQKNIVFFFLLILVLGITELLQLRSLLEYRRDLVLDEFWRLITAHVTHLNWRHTGMNVLGLLVIGSLSFTSFKPGRFLLEYVVLALVISVCLYLFHPAILWYVGASGVLHGLFVIELVRSRLLNRRVKAILLVLLGLKIGWELIFGALPGSATLAGGRVVVEAHGYGVLAGLVYILLRQRGRLSALSLVREK